MTLYLYNTLTRQKQAFQPLEASQVKVYCCGVTVYDYCHLGHARSYIVWDTLRRYLQWSGYGVRYVQNFTDIDDKILNRARTEGSTMEAVADRFTAAYFEDMARLNILAADSYPPSHPYPGWYSTPHSRARTTGRGLSSRGRCVLCGGVLSQLR